MPTTLEERVAYLEGKVEEHSKAWQDLKGLIIHLDGRMVHLEQRITELDTRINQRIDRLFFFILATLAGSIGSLIATIISLVAR
jgi:uncharacterized coiled-coil protein SlyX